MKNEYWIVFTELKVLFCESALRQLVEALLPRDLKLDLLRGSTGNSLSLAQGRDWVTQTVLSSYNFILCMYSLVSCHFFSRLSSITPSQLFICQSCKNPR